LSGGSNSFFAFTVFIFFILLTNNFFSYWGYFPASHFRLFLDVFLSNREFVVFNINLSYIFSSIFVYFNLRKLIFIWIQSNLSPVPNVLLKLLKITHSPLPIIFSLFFLRFYVSFLALFLIILSVFTVHDNLSFPR
jgi:hypothetical protein